MCRYCNKTTCLRDGQCLTCKPGSWGAYCGYGCPPKCIKDCDKVDKRCTRGCQDGYYGLFCERPCRYECIRWRCDQQTGACLEGHLQNGTIRLPDSMLID